MSYIEPAVVAKAREVDLLTYLDQREPDQLVRISAGTFCTKEHDSLKISNGKWYWWSRGIGGRSALDYLIAVKGMSFLEAVQEIDGGHFPDAPDLPYARNRYSGSEPAKRSEFNLPAESGTPDALAYLARRGIDSEILKSLSEEGVIFGSRRFSHQNVLFVGRDSAGTPRYAAVRSCKGDFKGEVAGSDKRFAFSLEQRSGPVEVHVFESAIDALSFATLKKLAGADWRSVSLLSLGGIPPARDGEDLSVPRALMQWLDDHPLCNEVHLHLDNDEPGRASARAIAERVASRVPASIEPPPTGKDVNDHLRAVLAQRERARSHKRETDREGR